MKSLHVLHKEMMHSNAILKKISITNTKIFIHVLYICMN